MPPVHCEWIVPPVPGLGSEGTPSDWNLSSCAKEVSATVGNADVWIGHDLGGVLAAMLAQPGETVILSGTALSLYWSMIRLTAYPGIQRYFYQRHGGRRFIEQGAMPGHREELLARFGEHGSDWSDRMRSIARGMTPPRGLAQKLRSCRVHLFWGRSDPWYPRWVAHSIKHASCGELHWMRSGHFVPWEAASEFSQALERVVSLQRN